MSTKSPKPRLRTFQVRLTRRCPQYIYLAVRARDQLESINMAPDEDFSGADEGNVVYEAHPVCGRGKPVSRP